MLRKFISFFIIFFICVMFVSTGINAFLKTDKGDTSPQSKIESETITDTPQQQTVTNETEILPALSNNSKKIVVNTVQGVWVTTVFNIDFPSKVSLSVDTLKLELDIIVSNCKNKNVNTIFFQVRPACDAFYNSDIFPMSKYLTGTQGKKLDNDFDVLAYLIKKAHENDIALHAWINPYRVTASENDALSTNSPAKKYPETVMKGSDNNLYFNPSSPKAQEIIIDGVRELVNKYDIDGIHFDDYFYPECEFDDSAEYKKYANGMNLDDFRRNSVDTLIKNTYEQIKALNSAVEFGVSPQAICKNFTVNIGNKQITTKGFETYTQAFADSEKWVINKWVDYICPQIYWAIGDERASFDAVAYHWSKLTDKHGVKLYIGHAAYKRDEFKADEYTKQLIFAKTLPAYKGSIFFTYSDLLKLENVF